jgi:hypothetical protein
MALGAAAKTYNHRSPAGTLMTTYSGVHGDCGPPPRKRPRWSVRRSIRPINFITAVRVDRGDHVTQSTVSLIVARGKPVTMLTVFERIADGLDMPDAARMRLGLAPKEVDAVRRRTALGTSLIALSPATLTAVLRESAAEAMDFTRQRTTTSSVGAGTLDHLEAVIIDLDRSYNWRPASELFPVARFYRQRVEQFINGKHTLAEAREL